VSGQVYGHLPSVEKNAIILDFDCIKVKNEYQITLLMINILLQSHIVVKISPIKISDIALPAVGTSEMICQSVSFGGETIGYDLNYNDVQINIIMK